MQSAHSETIAATFDCRRAGDTTSGRIILQGKSGAATRPLLTFSNNGNCIVPRGNYLTFQDFELQNSNATKTASIAFNNATTEKVVIKNIKCSNSTNKFWKFLLNQSLNTSCEVMDCEIGNTASFALDFGSAANNLGSIHIVNNWIYNCGGNAISLGSNAYFSSLIHGNVIYNTTGIGISYDNSRTDSLGGMIIINNTIDSSSSDGIKVVTSAVSIVSLDIVNNILSNNGGYGLNFGAAGHTDALLNAYGPTIRGNTTYNNTSGAYKSNTAGYAYNTCPWASGDSGLNPTYSAASSGNFMLGTNLKAQGYPIGGTLAVGTGSSTYSYVDPGAAQRQEYGPRARYVMGGF